jgi:GNAT superfamily N-acetyltransferase
MMEKVLQQILEIRKKRYIEIYKCKMPKLIEDKVYCQIAESYFKNQCDYVVDSKGKVECFIFYTIRYQGDLGKVCFILSNMYCRHFKKNKNDFLGLVKNAYKKSKEKDSKISAVLITVSVQDLESDKYFSKIGQLTAIELLGSVKESLNTLRKVKNINVCKIELLKKEDIDKCIELDIESHIKDPTSRMNKIFKKKNAKKFQKPFYQRLEEEKSAFVAKIGNDIAGMVGFFESKEERLGLVACIFVAQQFKNKGIGRMLYLHLLKHFKSRGHTHYLGSTTTSSVLHLAKKMKRYEMSRVYITKNLKMLN